ncbi:MAG: hypothetical protein ABIP88_03350 [Candidatus Binatia bacterium]
MVLLHISATLLAIFLTVSVHAAAARRQGPGPQAGAEAQQYIADGQYKLGVIKAREVLAKAEQSYKPNDIHLVNPLF